MVDVQLPLPTWCGKYSEVILPDCVHQAFHGIISACRLAGALNQLAMWQTLGIINEMASRRNKSSMWPMCDIWWFLNMICSIDFRTFHKPKIASEVGQITYPKFPEPLIHHPTCWNGPNIHPTHSFLRFRAQTCWMAFCGEKKTNPAKCIISKNKGLFGSKGWGDGPIWRFAYFSAGLVQPTN